MERAREIQRRRFQGEGIFFNSEMGNGQVRRHCALGAEEEELLQKRRFLQHVERILEAVEEACVALQGQDGDEGGALDYLNRASGALHGVAELDTASFQPIEESLQDMISIGDDLSRQLRDYRDGLEADPEELARIEQRLDQIRRLKGKYGATVEKIQGYYENLLREIDKLTNLKRTQEELRKRKEGAEAVLRKEAALLHNLRRKAADEVEKDITAVLATLQFADPAFCIDVNDTGDFGVYGRDEVRFRIRTNVGGDIIPLAQIASGGEMSRIMLAIKTVLARRDEIPTLIFDEIDSGISGRTAQSVAEKMSQIASFHQVICITHLPQIAAMADTHFAIEKSVEDGHTKTSVFRLSREQMIDELARLMGGVTITEAVRQNAREMKNLADQAKAAMAGPESGQPVDGQSVDKQPEDKQPEDGQSVDKQPEDKQPWNEQPDARGPASFGAARS